MPEMSLQTHRFIAVEGPIGAGKTTLAGKLAASFDRMLLPEKADENPFLDRFYRDRRGNALATQLFFLFQRSRQLDDLPEDDLFAPNLVADFLIEKDKLFAKLNLDQHEFELYQMVYDKLTIRAPKPDLVIYLQAPVDVLADRIRRRGIGYEQSISRDYLESLNAAYSEFFHYYDEAPLLIVNAAAIDFADNENHYAGLVEYLGKIQSGRHYFNPTFF